MKDVVIPASAPVIVSDEPPPFQTPSFTLTWPDDPQAKLRYALKPDTAYVLFLQRGSSLTGSQVLKEFHSIAEGRRIKVIDVDFGSVGFWEKMMERKLVHDWGMDIPAQIL